MTVTSNVHSGASAPEHVIGIVASAPSTPRSMAAGMSAKLAGVQERAGSGASMRPVLAIAEAPSANKLVGSAPTMGAVAGAVGHVSTGTSAQVFSRLLHEHYVAHGKNP